ncbi:hypothetical protein AL705_04155 [Lawsonella clevelandensis]|uniref:Uncharacterized protein n=1 Tax=Lawsonella clevelandensis TaxID=1528099 RepID=A0A0M4MXL7_9ACTN|nr:hypothetical protein AL705_04155 [Lawsonella clevelandensis]
MVCCVSWEAFPCCASCPATARASTGLSRPVSAFPWHRDLPVPINESSTPSTTMPWDFRSCRYSLSWAVRIIVEGSG